jgi:hypothetical protein
MLRCCVAEALRRSDLAQTHSRGLAPSSPLSLHCRLRGGSATPIGSTDAAVLADARVDAGLPDSGAPDSGLPDAGVIDDAGVPDAGVDIVFSVAGTLRSDNALGDINFAIELTTWGAVAGEASVWWSAPAGDRRSRASGAPPQPDCFPSCHQPGKCRWGCRPYLECVSPPPPRRRSRGSAHVPLPWDHLFSHRRPRRARRPRADSTTRGGSASRAPVLASSARDGGRRRRA